MLNHLINFAPKGIINVATIDDAICFGMHLNRSEPEIAEAMDICKALGDDTLYRPEEEAEELPQEQL